MLFFTIDCCDIYQTLLQKFRSPQFQEEQIHPQFQRTYTTSRRASRLSKQEYMVMQTQEDMKTMHNDWESIFC